MKSLQESLLDDEDDLIKSTDKDLKEKKKQEIIKYIEEHYWITNAYGNRLKISRAIKINKDWTVDILNKRENICYVEAVRSNNKDIFPTDNLFKWGEINTIYKIYGRNITKKEDSSPKKIKYIQIHYAEDIDLSVLPELDRLEVYNSNIKNLKGCPENIKSITISSCKEFTSLEGSPRELDFLNIQYCDSFISLKGCPDKINKGFWMACNRSLKSLDGIGKNTIRGAHFSFIRMPQLNIIPEEIVELGPIVVNNMEISQYKLKNNIK